MVNGFLNSAEQPFAKSVWDLCPFVLGLTASGSLRMTGGKLPDAPLPTTVHKTHISTLSRHVLFSARSVDGFQCDAIALPIHCYRREMLTRITSPAACVVELAQDFPASSHSVPLPHFFFFSHCRIGAVFAAFGHLCLNIVRMISVIAIHLTEIVYPTWTWSVDILNSVVMHLT